MSRIYENKKYIKIVEDIMFNSAFVKLKNDDHHGTIKYDHCRRVSYLSYLIARLFRCDYVASARAGLLHDFFYGGRLEKQENSYLNHPITSARNARKYFGVSKKEESIIRTHMFHQILIKKIFPFINRKEHAKVFESKPTCAEGWIVCIADLLISVYEVAAYKLRNTIKYAYNVSMLFLFNYMFQLQ